MRDARADQTADDHRDREGIDALVAHEVARAADRDEAADEHADEREEGVPGDPERPDHEVRVEGELDQVGYRLRRATEHRQADDHRDRRSQHEKADDLVLTQTEDIRRVDGAQEAEHEASDRVPRSGEPEDERRRAGRGREAASEPATPIRFQTMSYATDEMHRPGLAERVGMREADAEPCGRLARRRVMLAVDDVADPADREAQQDPRRRRVSPEADRKAAPHRRR